MKAEFRSMACGMLLFAGFTSSGHAAQSVSAPILLSQTTAPTGAYYEQNGTNLCGQLGSGSSGTTSSGGTTFLSVCRIDFAAPPTGKYLVVEHVACNLQLYAQPLTDISLATASGANDSRLVPLEPTFETTISDIPYYFYSLNDEVLYALRGTPRIVVRLFSEGGIRMTCQISGHLNDNK